MVNWTALANRKYDNLEQQADAATMQAETTQTKVANDFTLGQQQNSIAQQQAENDRIRAQAAARSAEALSDSVKLRAGTDLRYAKGTARVPGKGDPRKDTVPAKLAPGEAVLNKSAADTMGRGMIAALNKMGAQKMGMV